MYPTAAMWNTGADNCSFELGAARCNAVGSLGAGWLTEWPTGGGAGGEGGGGEAAGERC